MAFTNNDKFNNDIIACTNCVRGGVDFYAIFFLSPIIVYYMHICLLVNFEQRNNKHGIKEGKIFTVKYYVDQKYFGVFRYNVLLYNMPSENDYYF